MSLAYELSFWLLISHPLPLMLSSLLPQPAEPVPTAALKHLLQVISTFVKGPIYVRTLGTARGPSKGDEQSEGYIGDRETEGDAKRASF